MTAALGWARVRPPGGYKLRRGQWYAVVSDSGSPLVFLDVPQRRWNAGIPRNHLQIRRHPPERFAIVVRTSEDPNPMRGTPADLGLTYAVCPASGSRVRLAGRPEYLECPNCGHHSAIAWEEPC